MHRFDSDVSSPKSSQSDRKDIFVSEKNGREISFDIETNTGVIIEKRGTLNLKRLFTMENDTVFVEDFIKKTYDDDFKSTGKRVYDKEIDDLVTMFTTLNYPQFKPSERELEFLPSEFKDIYEIQDKINKLWILDSEYSALKEEIEALEGPSSNSKQKFLQSFYNIKNSLPKAENTAEKLKEELRDILREANSESNKEVRDVYTKRIADIRRELGIVEEEIRVLSKRLKEARIRFSLLRERLNGAPDFEYLIHKSRDSILRIAKGYINKLIEEREGRSNTVEDLKAASQINKDHLYLSSLIKSLS